MSLPEETTEPTTSKAQEPDNHLTVQTPQDAMPYSRVLYRRLQSALDAGNEMEGFNIVLQLLKENPQDTTARNLQRQLGQRVYKEVARDLAQVLSDGNLNRIALLVNRLRMMADEKQLSMLPGYRTAAARVDEAELRYCNAMLLSGISKLKDAKDAKEREGMAVSIENYAASKKLKISPEHRAVLDKVHADWKHHCHLMELNKIFLDQEAYYLEIKGRVEAGEDLSLCRDELVQCSDRVSELKELPETETLSKNISDTLQKVRSVLFAQTRRKVIVRSLVGILVTVVVFTSGLFIYAYIGAGSREENLRNAREARNLKLVRSYVEDMEPLRALRTLISDSYEAELAAAEAWLAEYYLLNDSLIALEAELQQAVTALNSPDVTAAQMTHGLALVNKAMKLIHDLDSRYNCLASENIRALMQAFNSSKDDMRPAVMARFAAPPAQLNLEQLDALYMEYLACKEFLKVTPEEDAEVCRAFARAVRSEFERLSASAASPEEAAAIVSLLDKHSEIASLDPSLRETMSDNSRRFTIFQQLPDKLTTVKTLPEYVAAIKDCGAFYKRVPNAVSVIELEAMVGNENEAMRAYKYGDFFKIDAATLTPEQRQAELQKYRDVYVDGKPLYDYVERNAEVQRVSNELVSDPINYWSDSFVRIINHSNQVCTGLLKDKDKKLVARIKVTEADIKKTGGRYVEGEKYRPNQKYPDIQPVHLKDCRSKMGITKANLTSGAVPPVQLLMNVIRYSNESTYIPVFARTYLVRELISIIDNLDPKASGVAFSPSLQADIAAFKKLPSVEGKHYGCWLKLYDLKYEEPYEQFFASVAPHDYCAEIRDSLVQMTDALATYVGFLDVEGNVIRTIPGDEPLYVMKNGVMVPYTPEEKTPYMPLFILSMPKQ